MSREKQIEKMADDVRRIRESYFGQADYLFAMKLYEDGYRKQSVGEWERTDEHEERYGYLYKCSVCEALCFIGKHCPHCGARMDGGKTE